MSRAIWSGAISFGLINIPVKLYTPYNTNEVSFSQLHKGCHGKIKYKKVCEKCGKEVSKNEIEKAVKITKDEYVVLSDDDLKSLPLKTIKSINILQFIEPNAIDILAVSGFYYIYPNNSDKPFILLREAMKKTNTLALAKFVMRNKEYLCALRPYQSGLVLILLKYPEDIREYRYEDKDVNITEEEFELAKKLVLTLKKPIDIENLKDEYREAISKLIQNKVEVKVDVKEEVKATKSLMDALKASLEVL